MNYIVTHGYTAHYDEILAVGLGVLRWGSIPVFRRTATSDELENPNVAVIDTGSQHDPLKSNWDHHQFDQYRVAADGVPDCSFSLMSRDFGMEEAFRYSNWYRKLRRIDARGGFAWAKSVGLPLPIPREILSDAISLGLRLEFEKCWGARPVPTDLVTFLSVLVTNLIKHGQKIGKEVDTVRQFGRIVHISGVKGVWTDFSTDVGMAEYVSELRRNGDNVAFTVSRNNDGSWLVYRVDNCPQMNLNVLEGMEEVEIINTHGKFVKFAGTISTERIKELIEMTIARPVEEGK